MPKPGREPKLHSSGFVLGERTEEQIVALVANKIGSGSVNGYPKGPGAYEVAADGMTIDLVFRTPAWLVGVVGWKGNRVLFDRVCDVLREARLDEVPANRPRE
jgi:hypothetical protein